jgi:putative transposase
MRYDPDRQHRGSLRLKDYDYAQPGAYFVTICTHNRECLLGEIQAGELRLNAWGQIVQDEWFKGADLRPYLHLETHEVVVMPNHIHGVLWLDEDRARQQRLAPTRKSESGLSSGVTPGSLGAVIGQFKAITSKRINQLRGTPGLSVWQRGYYEHVIRDEAALAQIREYIATNPLRWEQDPENPDRPSSRLEAGASGCDPE